MSRITTKKCGKRYQRDDISSDPDCEDEEESESTTERYLAPASAPTSSSHLSQHKVLATTLTASSTSDSDVNMEVTPAGEDSSVTVAELREALYLEAPRGKFATGGQVTEDLDRAFSMKVDGYGVITLPLAPTNAQKLIRLAKPSPFGKKNATLYDRKVRSSWQLEPSQIDLSKEWLAKFHTAVFNQVNTELSLKMDDPDELQLNLYKLLLYERGGHFGKHRDTEKETNMFGTLVLVLPCDFGGGVLLVQQEDWVKAFSNADIIKRSGRSEWAAFYTDCEHELKPITEGYRVALSFNMVRKPKQVKVSSSAPAAAAGTGDQLSNLNLDKVDTIAKILNDWIQNDGSKLGIVLKHHYSSAFLESTAALKGVDAETHALLKAAVMKVNNSATSESSTSTASASDSAFAPEPVSLVLHLCQVKVKENGYFVDEERESGRETEERTLYATSFTPGSYLEMVLGTTARLELDYLVLPREMKEEQLFQEDVEHTGNEGTTFQRWYTRAAIVPIDTLNPWEMVCQHSITAATKLFTKAVEGLNAVGTPAFASSHVGRIISASTQPGSTSSPFPQVAAFASFISRKLQEQMHQKAAVKSYYSYSSFDFDSYSSSSSSTTAFELTTLVLQFVNDLLRFRSQCVNSKDLVTAQRIDSILEEFIQSKGWFPQNPMQTISMLWKVISEVLVRLFVLDERHVKNWIQARCEEASSKLDFFIQLEKSSMSELQPGTQSAAAAAADTSQPKTSAKTFTQLQQLIETEAVTCCLRSACSKVGLGSSSTNRSETVTSSIPDPSDTVAAISELVHQLPAANVLGSQCSVEDLLRYIQCLVYVAPETCTNLVPALSVFVNALEYKAPPTEFIRGELYNTLLDIAKEHRQTFAPIQQLAAFVMTHIERRLQKVVLPVAGTEWQYPLSEFGSSICQCERCVPVVRFLKSNDCIYSYKAAEKDRSHVSYQWCRYKHSTLLAETTIRSGSPQTLILRKIKSNLERMHQSCQSEAELLLVLRRAFTSSGSSNATNSSSRTVTSDKNLTSILPYDVSVISKRITQLQVSGDEQYRTLEQGYAIATQTKKKKQAQAAKKAKLR